ncbi:MAG TPA: zinc ribbon domain-containing protein [Ktedonobacteraceae bacterium]|nr:zinc ribbon domain-containing protein [Ktedonobacteraceae bacterium]
MVYCRFCGVQLQDEAVFCQNCGRAQSLVSQDLPGSSSVTSPAASALKIVAGLLAGCILVGLGLKGLSLRNNSGAPVTPGPATTSRTVVSTKLENPLSQVNWTKTITNLGCDQPGGPQLGVELDEQQFADITADNKAEAFVAVSCVPSTSSWPSYLEVFDGASDPAHPRLLAVLLKDTDGVDERGLRIGKNADLARSIAITRETVTVISQGYASTDANCCSSKQVTDVFTWNGQRFVHSSRSVVSVS